MPRKIMIHPFVLIHPCVYWHSKHFVAPPHKLMHGPQFQFRLRKMWEAEMAPEPAEAEEEVSEKVERPA